MHTLGMVQIDITIIQRRLYDDIAVRNRLIRDYALDPIPEDAESLTRSLLLAFRQIPVTDPLSETIDNGAVYRAAIHALGSNSRSWSSFIRGRESLERYLNDYDLSFAPEHKGLLAFLPGQTGPADARAIIAWQRILSKKYNYYSGLVELGKRFRSLGIGNDELLPCVAVFIGAPPSERRVHPCLSDIYERRVRSDWKTPGMGPVLASEFLRNMGWNGFKPDRHVIRLLERWIPEVVYDQCMRAIELSDIIGTRRKDLVTFLTYSLTGIAVTPPDSSFSVTDNLIWTLGAYLETRNHESGEIYITDEAAPASP
jgi:hypothetical protein